jgi:hypothetical protein
MSFTAASRQAFRGFAKQQCRSFSGTASIRGAAEVKKLGVIGAGQMVCLVNSLRGLSLTSIGSRYSFGRSSEGTIARQIN